MKKLVPISLICLGAVGFSACSKYNDADLRGRTERIEHRLSEVETNLQSVRSLLKAQEAHAYITSFEPHSEGSGGYVITLSNGKTLKIFHGTNGQNGRDGVDGKNGKDGAPGRDGVDGKNGKDGAPGRDGVDGKNGKDGASSTMQITAIEEQDSYVRFTLADGRQIELARRAEMSFAFAEDADYAVFPNKRYEIRYTTQGLTAQSSLKVLAQNGYRAKLLRQSDEGGIIEVVAPSQVVDSELIVLLSDGRGAVKMYAMAIYAGMLTTSSESYMVERAGTTLSIPISTNTDYEVEMPQDATWLRRAGEGARALTVRQETLRLVVDANTTPGLRSTVVKLKSNGVTLRAITIAQRGESNTHNVQPGSLEATLGGHFPDELKLTGQLTPTDFQFLKDNSRKIRILDLSELDMTALPEDDFRGSHFEEVKLPKGLKTIAPRLFYNSKIKRLSIPETVTKIENTAFADCSGLTGELHLPPGLTSIGGNAFTGCSGLTGELHLPPGLTSIESSAFSYCSGLTELHLPSGLPSIGSYAFAGCSGLTGTLVIPASVKDIGYGTFKGATGLSKLVIEGTPSIYIYNEAFLKSNKEVLPLEAVYSKSEEPKAISSQAFWYGEAYGPKPKLLYVPRGTKAKYEALAGWNVFQKIEEMDVEAMPK